MEIRVTADKTTLSVMGADGVRHIIHSDEFGIAAILDVLGKANADAKDAERYRWLIKNDLHDTLFSYGGDKSEVDSAIDNLMQRHAPQSREGS